MKKEELDAYQAKVKKLDRLLEKALAFAKEHGIPFYSIYANGPVHNDGLDKPSTGYNTAKLSNIKADGWNEVFGPHTRRGMHELFEAVWIVHSGNGLAVDNEILADPDVERAIRATVNRLEFEQQSTEAGAKVIDFPSDPSKLH